MSSSPFSASRGRSDTFDDAVALNKSGGAVQQLDHAVGRMNPRDVKPRSETEVSIDKGGRQERRRNAQAESHFRTSLTNIQARDIEGFI